MRNHFLFELFLCDFGERRLKVKILFTFIHIDFITMNYGGGPYVLYQLSRTKEGTDQDPVMATKEDTTTILTREEVTNPGTTNTEIKVMVMLTVTSRIHLVDVEIVAHVWEQCAVSVVWRIAASSDVGSMILKYHLYCNCQIDLKDEFQEYFSSFF